MILGALAMDEGWNFLPPMIHFLTSGNTVTSGGCVLSTVERGEGLQELNISAGGTAYPGLPFLREEVVSVKLK